MYKKHHKQNSQTGGVAQVIIASIHVVKVVILPHAAPEEDIDIDILTYGMAYFGGHEGMYKHWIRVQGGRSERAGASGRHRNYTKKSPKGGMKEERKSNLCTYIPCRTMQCNANATKCRYRIYNKRVK